VVRQRHPELVEGHPDAVHYPEPADQRHPELVEELLVEGRSVKNNFLFIFFTCWLW